MKFNFRNVSLLLVLSGSFLIAHAASTTDTSTTDTSTTDTSTTDTSTADTNTTDTSNSSDAAKSNQTTSSSNTSSMVKTQGLPDGGIVSPNPATTAPAAAPAVSRAPNLSDFNVKLNIAHGNSIKITNVDLFSVVSDENVGDIYSIYSISNLKPVTAGCATILDGEIIFIASKGFLGDAVIDYTVIDGENKVSDTEQVTIHVVKE